MCVCVCASTRFTKLKKIGSVSFLKVKTTIKKSIVSKSI